MATGEIVLAEYQALVVKPGDKVLLDVGDRCSAERAEAIRDRLRDRFPDIDFVIISGAHVEAVQRAE